MGNKVWSIQEEAHLLFKVRDNNLYKYRKNGDRSNAPYIPKGIKTTKLAEEISNKYGRHRNEGSIICKFRDLMSLVGVMPDVTVDSVTDLYVEKATEEKEHALLSLQLDKMPKSFENKTPDSNYIMIDVAKFNELWSTSTNVWDCLNEATVC